MKHLKTGDKKQIVRIKNNRAETFTPTSVITRWELVDLPDCAVSLDKITAAMAACYNAGVVPNPRLHGAQLLFGPYKLDTVDTQQLIWPTPTPPDETELEVPDWFGWVQLAASTDTSRAQLNGMYISPNLVACTDGHRAHVWYNKKESWSDNKLQFIIPQAAFSYLAGTVKISHQSVSCDTHGIFYPPITEVFPPVETLINNYKFDKTNVVNTSDLIKILKMAMVNYDGRGVLLNFTPLKIEVSTDNFFQSIETNNEHCYDIKINPQYLIDALKIDNGDVSISVENTAISVTNGCLRAIVMGMNK